MFHRASQIYLWCEEKKISICSEVKKIRVIVFLGVACSRRSDSGARAKNKASERAGKKRGETGEEDDYGVLFPSLPSFFSRSFARFIFRSRSTI